MEVGKVHRLYLFDVNAKPNSIAQRTNDVVARMRNIEIDRTRQVGAPKLGVQ
jgi:hypothetical protein